MSTSGRRTPVSLLAAAVVLSLAGCQSPKHAEESHAAVSTPPEKFRAAKVDESAAEAVNDAKSQQPLDRVDDAAPRVHAVAMREQSLAARLQPAPAMPMAPTPPPPSPAVMASLSGSIARVDLAALPKANAENYANLLPNPVRHAAKQSLSTFTASTSTPASTATSAAGSARVSVRRRTRCASRKSSTTSTTAMPRRPRERNPSPCTPKSHHHRGTNAGYRCLRH